MPSDSAAAAAAASKPDLQTVFLFTLALSIVVERFVESSWIIIEKWIAAATDTKVKAGWTVALASAVGVAVAVTMPDEVFALSGFVAGNIAAVTAATAAIGAGGTGAGANVVALNANALWTRVAVGVGAGVLAPHSHEFVKLGFNVNQFIARIAPGFKVDETAAVTSADHAAVPPSTANGNGNANGHINGHITGTGKATDGKKR